MFGNIKLYISILIIAGSVASIAYSINRFHYRPIRELQEKNHELELELYDLGIKLNKCLSDKKKDSIDSFIDGINAHDENITIDINNLHT